MVIPMRVLNASTMPKPPRSLDLSDRSFKRCMRLRSLLRRHGTPLVIDLGRLGVAHDRRGPILSVFVGPYEETWSAQRDNARGLQLAGSRRCPLASAQDVRWQG